MAKLSSLKPTLGMLGPRVAPAPKTADPFYLSSEWRQLVASIRRQRGGFCERCGSAKGRIIGDHIRERRDGGAELDPSNIMLLCMPCHGQKTAEARAKRAKGQTA